MNCTDPGLVHQKAPEGFGISGFAAGLLDFHDFEERNCAFAVRNLLSFPWFPNFVSVNVGKSALLCATPLASRESRL